MKRKRLILFIFIIVVFMLVASLANAQGGFDLFWWSVDSGGGQTNGGDYSLQGVIGQPDAGNLQGGDYRLAGGFLSGAVASIPPRINIFIPIINK